MKLFDGIVVTALGTAFGISASASANESVHLFCAGPLRVHVATTGQESTDEVKSDWRIDLRTGEASVDGFVCMLAPVVDGNCYPKIKFEVKDDELVYSKSGNGMRNDGLIDQAMSSIKIDRSSLLLRITENRFMAIDKNRSHYITRVGTLNCKVVSKAF